MPVKITFVGGDVGVGVVVTATGFSPGLPVGISPAKDYVHCFGFQHVVQINISKIWGSPEWIELKDQVVLGRAC